MTDESRLSADCTSPSLAALGRRSGQCADVPKPAPAKALGVKRIFLHEIRSPLLAALCEKGEFSEANGSLRRGVFPHPALRPFGPGTRPAIRRLRESAGRANAQSLSAALTQLLSVTRRFGCWGTDAESMVRDICHRLDHSQRLALGARCEANSRPTPWSKPHLL